MVREAKTLRSRGTAAGAGVTALGVAAVAALSLGAGEGGAVPADAGRPALLGEARSGAVTVELAPAADVAITDAKAAGRPIVVIDPGHGGRDPGATGVSGTTTEKELALVLARELRERLAERGRVRVALTRDDDRYLTLDQRAAIARRLNAALYLSLHLDSAPNPMARGATIYSLSDVASDSAAERLAAAENAGATPPSTETDGSVRAMLADLALRDRMEASAGLAERLVRKSQGRVLLRPDPHRFAAFHVLRRAEVPAVLVEAAYISNAEDEQALLVAEKRAGLIEAMANAIEADLASRIIR